MYIRHISKEENEYNDNLEELKRQLEAKEVQQKEFIKLLEVMYHETEDIWYIKILNEYKEIIGVENANK